MKKYFIFFLTVLIGLMAGWASGPGPNLVDIKGLELGTTPGDIQPQPPNGVKPAVDVGKTPLYFITNRGQVNGEARFYAKASRYTLWMTKQGLVFDSFKSADDKKPAPDDKAPTPAPKMLRDFSNLTFLNAAGNPEMVALEETGLKVNYLIGNDRSKWRCDVPTSMAVLYKSLYQNIDLKVYGIEKQIEYDWIVKVGGDPQDIKFEYQNVKGTRIDDEGNLLIETNFGELVHKRPFSYQEDGNEKVEIASAFKKIAENTYGFEIGAYDPERELIIDPVVLAYSTYLGGGNSDTGRGIAVDGNGIAYISGYTTSNDFPTFNEYQLNPDVNNWDIFVTKLDTTKSGAACMLYSTYLGGTGADNGNGIAIDGSGNAYVTGLTHSTDFPTVNQYMTEPGDAGTDMFVAKLDTTKSGAASLVYSTYMGGNGFDNARGIAADAAGNAYVAGDTRSTDFPTVNQYQAEPGDGNIDAIVFRLDTNQSGAASLVYSTYLAGALDDFGLDIAVGTGGIAYMAGHSLSTDFPLLNQYQTKPAASGVADITVVKLDTNQSGTASLLYSTYLGGTDSDAPYGIDVDGGGNVYVAGNVGSTDFPVVNGYQGDPGDNDTDVFFFKLDPSRVGTAQLRYSTYLGGGGMDFGFDVAVDDSGNAYVSGRTESVDFPTVNQYQSDPGDGLWDAFVARIDPTQAGAASLVYSTYVGGSAEDYGFDIAVDNNGNAYLRGSTNSTDFPLLNQYQTDQVTNDIFITKLYYPVTPTVTAPTVDTPTSASVTYTTATLGGNVSNTNGANVTERGIYWSTTDGFTPPGQGTKVSETGDWGTGVFTVNVTGLPAGTTIYFQAFAVNSGGTGYSGQSTFTTSTYAIPTITTAAMTNITSTTADSGGNVTADGGSAVTARGICWGTAPNPTTADNTTLNGTGTGAFVSNITGLVPGTVYYVRAYAVNTVGTAYGNGVSFTASAQLATVTTKAVTDITSTTATGGGNVTSDGGSTVTDRGLCWGATPNPTTAGNKVSRGSGTGSFNGPITGLGPGKTYYVRAFAVNGAGTVYGNEVNFTTPEDLLTVTITNPGHKTTVSGTVTITADVVSPTQGVEKVTFHIDNNDIGQDTTEPYETDWDTTAYANGTHKIKVVAYNSANQWADAEITVYIDNSGSSGNTPPEMLLNRTHLNFGSVSLLHPGSTEKFYTTGSQTIAVNNVGGGTLNWTAETDAQWLTCTPQAGTGLGAVSVSVDPSGLETGTHDAVVTIRDPGASNSPQTVTVSFRIYDPNTTTVPFGYFETPGDDAVVKSSVPLTGWVLDDIDISSVKIYRNPVEGHDTGGLAYIGEAVMVDGARPDVELQYPTYPKNYQAGWGYMLLTNLLPFNGNGTFTIHAMATDQEGNEVTLGSKTITCDNTNVKNPFGAIDTPEQGGIASGTDYVNFGWTLTPRPNTIPTDGSTIRVWVDGVQLGNPVYNRYREDIADLFPNYNNSNGAGGYFYLDTTAYLNGVHTIAWTVEDDDGNNSGIGSRYFTIQNGDNAGTLSKTSAKTTTKTVQQRNSLHFGTLPVRAAAPSPGPVFLRNGVDPNNGPETLYPGDDGVITVQAVQDRRIEIHLKGGPVSDRVSEGGVVSGYLLKGDRLQLLPVGSTMDMNRGIFYWQPAAGFLGQYRFVFVEKTPDGRVTGKQVRVVISPKY